MCQWMKILAYASYFITRYSPVHWYGDECEDADVNAERLGERAELAHELWQVPSLQKGRVKLQNDDEMCLTQVSSF